MNQILNENTIVELTAFVHINDEPLSDHFLRECYRAKRGPKLNILRHICSIFANKLGSRYKGYECTPGRNLLWLGE